MFSTVDSENTQQVTSQNRDSSPSRDVRDAAASTTAAKRNTRELTCNMLIKELVFCIALALTTYGALHNSPSKISKHPQASRFFSRHSVVTDWYMGQLSKALAVINNVDVAFVMYYAPWDAESQFVRGEFEKAAGVMSERVHFSAINCWNPGSECRLQHHKIPSWPILMAYTINAKGVFYKGPRDAHSIVKFLELIMNPLERVASTDDLVNLLSICDAVAVGYTPMKDTSRYYNIWHHVAVKSREFDILGEICFAAVTSEELAIDLGVDSLPSARLLLWNDTKEYKVEDNLLSWNESHLMAWVLDNFVQPVARIVPMWKKAFSFERYFDGSPILILFTPLNPLYELLPSYALLREVAMEYYDCKNNESSQWSSELMKLQQVQRLLHQKKDVTKFCQEYKFKKPVRKPNRFYRKEVVSQNNKYPWSNTTQKRQKNGFFNFLLKRGLEISKLVESGDENAKLVSSLGLLQECSSAGLLTEKTLDGSDNQCQQYEEEIEIEELEKANRDTETSMLPFDEDPLSPESLIQDNVKHFCKLMRFARAWGPLVSPAEAEGHLTDVRGLACARNYSLNMIAVDSDQNHHFAESLGIDITNTKDMTAVVILDGKHESQYILSEEYSAKSLRDFVHKFTFKSLKRSLRTRVESAVHTHHFGSTGGTEQMSLNDSAVYITDLTTKTFRRFVRTSGTVSVLAVCGGVCGTHTTRALVAAARLLVACGVAARAARVDALRHDLPWHYTADTYPAVLVFAASREGEPDSRQYPAQARVSASGLVALALRLLGTPQHLRVRLALCARTQANIEKKTCLRDLKGYITLVIGRNLKYWRRTEDKRLKDAFLRRLQYLHPISLELSLLHVSDLSEIIKKQKTLLNSLNNLSEYWNIDALILGNFTVASGRR